MGRPSKRDRKLLEKENRKWPEELKRVTDIPPGARMPPGLIEVWRSRGFLVQVFREGPGLLRLTVCRSSHNGDRWVDGISWDDLQRLKRECGRGDLDAVEVYPRDCDVVDVANMRHLFVFEGSLLPYAWRR